MRTITIVLCLAGCAGAEGIDIALAPDPSLNTEAELLETVDSVVVVIDSEEGLFFTGDEREGAVSIKNVDGDAPLEVVSTVVMPNDHLPIVRVLRGTMPDVVLDVRLLGIPPAGGPPVALGRAQGIQLGDPIERVEVPFNLRPDLLPPRVTQVLPGDGVIVDPCSVSMIILMFSAPIEASTVASAVRVNDQAPDDVIVESSGLTATLMVSNVEGAGASLSYDIEVEPTILGRDGRPLDQVPSQPDDQGLSASFTLACSLTTAPADACGGCGQSGLGCVEGECVPNTCENVSCTEMNVCDPNESRCLPDCRVWGDDLCPDARPRCDMSTGVCVDEP
jgi:hypothetical protein